MYQTAAPGTEMMFRVDGNRSKILPLWIRSLRHFKVKPHHIVQDLYKVTRAYLW